MDQISRYEFPAANRQALESLPHALAVYQYVQGKVETLLVSDGYCRLKGIPRTELVCNMDTNMFGSVHPDDVELLAKLGYEFSKKEGVYDIIYRTRLFGYDDYRTVHAVGKHQTMENGARIAFITYVDVTDTPQHQLRALAQVESPKCRFLEENMGALAIVSREDKRLLFYNHALALLLPPKSSCDSGITFRQFFFGDDSAGLDEIFFSVDTGPHIFDDPVIPRKLEVNVISTTFADEPAYAVYFYAFVEKPSPTDSEAAQRRARASFNAAMFIGESNSLAYYENWYRGFRVWNLSKDMLVLDAGCSALFASCCEALSFDGCVMSMQSLCDSETDGAMIASLSRQRLLFLFESGSYPRQEAVTIFTEHGTIYLSLQLTMMRSPDSGDVFLKIQESNVTDETVLEMLVAKTVEQEYDYVAYSDLDSNRCYIISGKLTASGKQHYSIRTTDFIRVPSDIRTFPTLFPPEVQSLEDMHNYLLRVCDEQGRFTSLQELPGGAIKSIYFELIDSEHRTFYIRCKDVTKLLHFERERKQELECAVKTATERSERLLLQTVLSISNALDARDPVTSRHSQRVAHYSAEIARRYGWAEDRVQNLYNVALVHDIGKIGVPDAVLQKCGKLTNEEYLKIQDHVAIGGFILKDFSAIDRVAEGALYHHERYDGKGYLRGLAGEEIPIEARIICIADATDAMNSTRPYRKRQTERYIRGELRRERGKQFDPALVDIMLSMINDGILESC